MRKLILFLFLIVCGLFNNFQAQNNYVEKGQIDFSIINLENNPVKLNGSWEFYWNQLLTKDQIKNDSVVYWNIEKTWNSYIHNQQKVGAFGCATYRVHIKNLPNRNCDILIKSVLCACKIFINDSLIAEIGKVGYSKEEYTPRWEDRIISIPHNLKNFDLIVQIANYHHRNGGFESPFIIGLAEDIKDLKYVNIIYNSFITSALIFSGLFFLTIFLFRKKDLSMLFFALYCLINSARPFFSGDYFIVSIFPNISWHTVIFIEYITLIVPVIFILLFINEHFKDYSNSNLIYTIAAILAIEVIVLAIFPTDIFTWLVISHEIILIFSMVFIAIIIIKALVFKANGAIFAFFSILSLIASAVISILNYTGVIDSLPFIFFILQILFILMMSLILGSNFSSQFSKVEFLQRYTENQKHLIEEKHREITDSINYAERIQRSFLATKELLDENLQDYFVFFQPKEVVSGDFYWATSIGSASQKRFYICCADSTGHGVPGAIMSILNISSLEKAIETEVEPHLILGKTRELIINRLKKDGSPEGGKDGMDCSLLVFNQDKNQLTFASANNPVFIVRAVTSSGSPEAAVSKRDTHELLELVAELVEAKPDKMPVGKHDKDQEPFTLQTVSLQKGDVIYTLTDGFPDQFGGEKGKKYMIKNLKELFMSIAHLPMQVQEQKLKLEFETWKAENEQIDDVCIIGVRI
jgi:serine phosphatase RsbU (regulator of sigma subunit)